MLTAKPTAAQQPAAVCQSRGEISSVYVSCRLGALQVSAPKVGEKHPASVLAEVVIDTRGMRGDVASGWDEIKQHDVLFCMAGEPYGLACD